MILSTGLVSDCHMIIFYLDLGILVSENRCSSLNRSLSVTLTGSVHISLTDVECSEDPGCGTTWDTAKINVLMKLQTGQEETAVKTQGTHI